MIKRFYISDTHFGHKNIIKLAGRPFKDVHEMDYALVKNWNSVVSPMDEVYHLGDFAWFGAPKYFHELNGLKHLIKGNHDKDETLNLNWLSVRSYLELYDEETFVVLFHYPIYEWNKLHHGSVHLFGHVHGNLGVVPTVLSHGHHDKYVDSKAFDVGVECIGYTPRTLKEILDVR